MSKRDDLESRRPMTRDFYEHLLTKPSGFMTKAAKDKKEKEGGKGDAPKELSAKQKKLPKGLQKASRTHQLQPPTRQYQSPGLM